MELSNEQLAKARAAKSPEELLALAKENNVELTKRVPRRTLTGCTPRPASCPTTSWTTWPAAAATPAEDALKPPAAISAGTMWMDPPPSA